MLVERGGRENIFKLNTKNIRIPLYINFSLPDFNFLSELCRLSLQPFIGPFPLTAVNDDDIDSGLQ